MMFRCLQTDNNMMASRSSSRLPLLLVLVLGLVAMSQALPGQHQQQQHFRFARSPNGFEYKRREKSGFYTTRFGKRNFQAPVEDLDEVLDESEIERLSDKILSSPIDRPIGMIARNIEGFDEFRMPVSCIYAGFKHFYVCDKHEPWSKPAVPEKTK